MNLKGRSALATALDLQSYENKKKELEDELERRKELGFRFQQTLHLQNEIFVKDEDERERHQVNFMALVREITRLLRGHQRWARLVFLLRLKCRLTPIPYIEVSLSEKFFAGKQCMVFNIPHLI